MKKITLLGLMLAFLLLPMSVQAEKSFYENAEDNNRQMRENQEANDLHRIANQIALPNLEAPASNFTLPSVPTCASSATTRNYENIPMVNFNNLALQAEQLKALRLQNQILQQQLDNAEENK